MGPALGIAPARGLWGYKLAGPLGARRPPARTHALGPGTGKSGGRPSALTNPPCSCLRAPTASRSPLFSQGPMVASPPRKSPDPGPSPRHGARGPWGFHHPQTPTSAHACFRAGTGKSPGQTHRLQPRHAPAQEPPDASRLSRLSQGPMVCYSHHLLPTGRRPYRTIQSALITGSPHIVCSGSGENPTPLLFSRALCAVPRHVPGVVAVYMHAGRWAHPARRSRTGVARLRMGGCPCVFANPHGPRRGGRRQARWLACPGPRPGCRRACARVLVRALAPTLLRQPRASRQSVLSF